MTEFQIIKTNYLNLREALIRYLRKNFTEEESYFYQPTLQSNSVAWIAPHLFVFEQIKIFDQIGGYDFPQLATQEQIERYKPGVDGFVLKRNDLMEMEEAITYLEKIQEISVPFLNAMISQSSAIKDVDPEHAFNRYMLNFSHETEHYGQIKYLIGTWKRLFSQS